MQPCRSHKSEAEGGGDTIGSSVGVGVLVGLKGEFSPPDQSGTLPVIPLSASGLGDRSERRTPRG